MWFSSGYSLAKYELGYVSAIFSSKKKEKARPHFIPDLCQRGAILWQVMLDDSGQGQQVECFLGLTTQIPLYFYTNCAFMFFRNIV